MLMPKRVKHRKQFRGRMKGKAQRGNTLAYGEFGLQADPLHQAWRSGMDQDFPRQTGNGQARRDPHGFR